MWLFPRLRVNRARECPLYNNYLVKLYFIYKLWVTYVTQEQVKHFGENYLPKLHREKRTYHVKTSCFDMLEHEDNEINSNIQI